MERGPLHQGDGGGRWALMAVWRVAGADALSVALTVGSGRYVFTVSQEELMEVLLHILNLSLSTVESNTCLSTLSHLSLRALLTTDGQHHPV